MPRRGVVFWANRLVGVPSYAVLHRRSSARCAAPTRPCISGLDSTNLFCCSNSENRKCIFYFGKIAFSQNKKNVYKTTRFSRINFFSRKICSNMPCIYIYIYIGFTATNKRLYTGQQPETKSGRRPAKVRSRSSDRPLRWKIVFKCPELRVVEMSWWPMFQGGVGRRRRRGFFVLLVENVENRGGSSLFGPRKWKMEKVSSFFGAGRSKNPPTFEEPPHLRRSRTPPPSSPSDLRPILRAEDRRWKGSSIFGAEDRRLKMAGFSMRKIEEGAS